MEYVYAAMLIHKAGKKIDEATVTKVLEAAGVSVDPARVKALVAALEGVNIDEAIEKAAVAPVAAAPVTQSAAGATQKAESQEEKKEQKKSPEEAAAGLGALFG